MSVLKAATFALLAIASSMAAPVHAGNIDDVIKSGVLRACTPGDYKPFSFAKPDGTYEGIDIDLMQSLAASLGVKVEYVKTTWANLLADFTANKCDIAVGGISVTLDRQKRVGFSNAYMVNGKTPLVRCADVKRFQTVADIDKAGCQSDCQSRWQQRAVCESELQDSQVDDSPGQPRNLRRGAQRQR